MKLLALAAVFSVSIVNVSGCCQAGCFCGKIEPRSEATCQSFIPKAGASIANYAAAGNCLNLTEYSWAYVVDKHGCASSEIDVKYYHSKAECEADPHGDGGFAQTFGHNGGDCLTKPPGAYYARAVCN